MPESTISRHLDQLIRELEDVLEEHGTTRAAVQRQLGWGNSRISDLKANPSTLKMSDLLRILEVVDVEPWRFFERVHGRAEPPAEVAEVCATVETLVDRLERLSEFGQPAPPAARRTARAAALLLRPLTRALRSGATEWSVEAALVESAVVVLCLCVESLGIDWP